MNISDAIEYARSHPWRFVRDVVAFAIAVPCFFCVVSFFAALTPEEAIAKYGQPLPPGWTVGVMNHGQYYQWYLIGERPWLFAVTFAYLTSWGLIGMASGVRKLWQRWSGNRPVELS